MDAAIADEESDIIAVVAGEPLKQLPGDLYIPPDALQVLLDTFSGPLDLLLYLIRKQNVDILNIPITLITQQYMQYIEVLQHSRLELAADYLVMAAWLAEIKSRMLLPAKADDMIADEEEDPRMALVKRLQQYEQFKHACDYLDTLPRLWRDVFPVHLKNDGVSMLKAYPDLELNSLACALKRLLVDKAHHEHHQIVREPISVGERMRMILNVLQNKQNVAFCELVSVEEGRMGIVVNLLAILELSKQSLLLIIQADLLTTIHLRAPS